MKKKLIIIIAASLLAVVLATSVTSVALANTPQSIAARAVSNTSDDLLARPEFEPLVQLFTGGSLQFSLNSVKDEDGYDYFRSNYVTGKAYLSTDAAYLTDVDVRLGEVNLEGSAYISDDFVYVSENEILRDSFGVKYSQLASEFSQSIFAPNSGSKYALSDKDYTLLLNEIQAANSYKTVKKEFSKLSPKIAKNLYKIVVDAATISKTNESIWLSGETTPVRLITFTIDGNAMTKIVSQWNHYLRNSEDIIEFLRNNESAIKSAMGLDKSISLVKEYRLALEEIKEVFDEIAEILLAEVETIKIKVATPKTSKNLLKLTVQIGGIFIFEMDCGKDGYLYSDKIDIKCGESQIIYHLNANDKKNFEATLLINLPSDSLELEWKVDKQTNQFEARLTYAFEYYINGYYNTTIKVYTERVASGSILHKHGKTTLNVDSFGLTEYQTKNGTLSSKSTTDFDVDAVVVIDTNDKMPSVPRKYKKLSTLTERDFENLLDGLDTLFGY